MRSVQRGPRLATLILASAPLIGCGSSDSSAPTTPRTAEDQFPSTLATAICNALESCCASASFDYDRAACLDKNSSEMTSRLEETQGYDSAAAGQCVGLFNQGTCEITDDALEVCQAVTAFQDVGSPCQSDHDCRVPNGSDTSQCKDGSCTTRVTKKGSIGSGCSLNCATASKPTHCINLETPQTPSEAKGAACYLDEGIVCDPTTFKCIERAKDGTACPTVLLAVWGFCADGYTCAGTPQKCTKSASLGSPCLDCPDENARCEPGAVCRESDHTCVAAGKGAIGEPCSSDAECASGSCQAGQNSRTCQPPTFASSKGCAGKTESW